MELKKIYDEKSLPVALDFVKDDFMANSAWASEADIVFANATCFEKDMVGTISSILNKQLKKGAVVILSSKSLEYDDEQMYTVEGPYQKLMSWGEAKVTVYIKN